METGRIHGTGPDPLPALRDTRPGRSGKPDADAGEIDRALEQSRATAAEGVTGDGCTGSTSQPSRSGRTVGVVDNRAEVGDFLTSRRAKITPERAGIPAGGRRQQRDFAAPAPAAHALVLLASWAATAVDGGPSIQSR
jgi:hypothetical protein